MAPDSRAGLVQEMNAALSNQICKADLEDAYRQTIAESGHGIKNISS